MMKDQNGKKGKHRGRWVIIIGCIILLIISFLAIWFYTPLLRSKPQVRIVQPETRLAVRSGDGVILKVEATSHNGFDSLVFLLDDEFESQQIITNSQQNLLNLTFPWYSSQTGVHKLSVVAYSSEGIPSEPSTLLVMVNPQELGQNAQINPQESVEQQAAEPVEPGSESIVPQSEVEAPQQANLDGGIVENLDWFISEVDEVGNFPVPLPDLPNDQIPWITRFDIFNDRNGNPSSGTVTIAAADDTGLSRIIFSIANLSDPLHPFNQDFLCGGELTCEMGGDFQLPEGGWVLGARAVDVFGQASALSTRQIHVLAGDDPQAVAEGDEEQFIFLDPTISGEDIVLFDTSLDDIGDPQIAEYGCSGQIVYLEVPYTYKSDHGVDVYLGATAESGNVMVAAGHAKIQPGSGVARIQMEPIAPELADQTDKLELYFRTGPDYFYTETAPLAITWPIPEPDLKITAVDLAESLISVRVKNVGCASVEGFEIGFFLPEDQTLIEQVDQLLSPGAEYAWEGLVNPNLFSRAFQTAVDPGNAILEIDESNNSFSLSAIAIDYLEVYKIDIHNISEGILRGDRGEFEFWMAANGIERRSPSMYDSYWSLPKGSFEVSEFIEPIIIHPPAEWNRDLYFLFQGWEDDDGWRDFLGNVRYLHSFDMFQEGNWKAGGEFSQTSDDNFYTVFWRIVLKPRY